jgi:hypothetical protein
MPEAIEGLLAGTNQLNAANRRAEMKIAMMTFTLIAAISVSSSAVGWYSAVAAYGACQEQALKGLHYAINGDCPNWEAWKANHARAQSPPQRHVYSTSKKKRSANQ